MTTERVVRIVAGSFILISLALGVPASPFFHTAKWLYFTLFVGFNLFQSGITRFCPMELVLRAIGVRSAEQPRAPRAAQQPGPAR